MYICTILHRNRFCFKLPELGLDPDLVVKFPDPDPAKRSGSDRIRIRNTDGITYQVCGQKETVTPLTWYVDEPELDDELILLYFHPSLQLP